MACRASSYMVVPEGHLAEIQALLRSRILQNCHLRPAGSGKSQPNAAEDLQGSLIENNTPKLVEDIEKLQEHLKVDKWGMVLGGSWGSTLALAYAEAHPAKVRTLLLRGVFLFEPVRLRRPSSSTRERRDVASTARPWRRSLRVRRGDRRDAFRSTPSTRGFRENQLT